MERESKPLVSVLMGVRYRRESTFLLERAVRSILNQTYGHLECIICDDGSTQEAAALVDRLAREDGRIVIVRRGDLLGLSEKLNACFSVASGAYVARMDDDDYSHADRLEKQIDFLQDRPQIGFVGSSVAVMEDGRFLRTHRFPAFPRVEDFFFSQPFIHPTLVFRREVMHSAGGYSEKKTCQLCEDYDLLLRLYQMGIVGANLSDTLLDYTVSRTPETPRRMRHRLNEAITRYERFKALGELPRALPYVMKPILTGMLPQRLVYALKNAREER